MAFIPVSNLLEMGGGIRAIEIDAGTVFVNYEDDVLHVIRGVEKTMTIYVDEDGKKRASINYSLWLPSGVSVDTSTWTVENNDTSMITLADDASDGVSTEVYVTASTRDRETWIKNTIVTDATIPETISNSILVKCVRRVG